MKVFVYYNIHKKTWSIKALEGDNKNRVIGYANSLILTNCFPKISEAGRQRVLKEKVKNVHAGIVGILEAVDIHSTIKGFNGFEILSIPDNSIQIRYNPYEDGYFKTLDNKKYLNSEFVYFTKNRTVFIYDGKIE